jgi:hypothetical protein
MRRGLALALLVAVSGTLAPVVPATAEEAPGFAPPLDRPVILTRILTRSLFDGNRILVARSWRITLAREPGGYRVTGEQVASRVEAPPALASLAAMERARTEPSLFPLRLDDSGRMIGDAAGYGGEQTLFDQAAALVAARAAQGSQGAEAERFLAQISAMAQGPITSHWPSLLFVPGEAETLSRDLILPDGRSGRFASEVERIGGGPGGLPSAVERRIVTIVEGSESATSERWTFAFE